MCGRQSESRIKSKRDAYKASVLKMKSEQLVIYNHFSDAWWRRHLRQILTFIPPVFKPSLHDFSPAFSDHASEFRDLMRLETAIECERKIVQPHLAFVTGF